MNLENYLNLKKQLEIKERLLDALRVASTPTLSDSVKGSMPVFPFSQVSIHIEGLTDYSYMSGEIDRLEYEIARLREDVTAAEIELKEYIDAISEEELREIFRCRYFYGWSVRKIGDVFHYDGSTVLRKLNKSLTE